MSALASERWCTWQLSVHCEAARILRKRAPRAPCRFGRRRTVRRARRPVCLPQYRGLRTPVRRGAHPTACSASSGGSGLEAASVQV